MTGIIERAEAAATDVEQAINSWQARVPGDELSSSMVVECAEDLPSIVHELVAELKSARAEEQQWVAVAQKFCGVGTPSMLAAELQRALDEGDWG